VPTKTALPHVLALVVFLSAHLFAQSSLPNNLPQRNPSGYGATVSTQGDHLQFVFTDAERGDLVAFLNAL
jgi:hypothetical protein